MARAQNIVYKDLRGDMEPNPATDDLLLRTNEDAIKYSVYNLLLTNFNERPFNPRLGSNINALLFENDTPQTAQLLRDAIVETIDNFEPRCVLTDVIVIPNPDQNEYQVEITFMTINNEEPQSFAFILDRVR